MRVALYPLHAPSSLTTFVVQCLLSTDFDWTVLVNDLLQRRLDLLRLDGVDVTDARLVVDGLNDTQLLPGVCERLRTRPHVVLHFYFGKCALELPFGVNDDVLSVERAQDLADVPLALLARYYAPELRQAVRVWRQKNVSFV